MDRRIPTLAIVLAVQLVLTIVVTWWQSESHAKDAKPFLTVDRAAIDRITIDDGDGKSLVIAKAGDGWTLPSVQDLPADTQKVTDLLDKLTSGGATWPVATTDSAAKRFEVTEAKFQRRIRMAKGDDALVDLYLGTSPGFRKVHARLADESNVYAITFANYDATTKAQDWLSKSLIAPDGTVTAIERPGAWQISKDGEAWKLAGLGDGQTTSEDKVRDMASKLENLRVIDVADDAAVKSIAEATPTVELTATTAKAQVTYQLYRPTPNGDFLVRASTRPQTFRLAAFTGEAFNVARDSLIAAPAPSAPATGAATPAPSSSSGTTGAGGAR
jgi:hypothetical protein